MTLIKEKKMRLARVGTLGLCSLSCSLFLFLTKPNQNELMDLKW